jgi:hypothetical protein
MLVIHLNIIGDYIMKKIIILSITLLIGMLFLSCLPFLEMQLAGTWYAGETDNIRLTIESDESFMAEIYDDEEDIWNTLAMGDSYTLTDNTLKFDYTHIDMFAGLEEVEQPYSYYSTTLFDGSTLVTMTHPLYLLTGYIMRGGDPDTLIGTWESEMEFITTEEGTTETGIAEVTLTLNNDDTYTLEIVDEEVTKETSTENGTYTIDTVSEEISLTPDGETEADVYPYKVVIGGLLFGNDLSTHGNFEALIYTKE